MNFVKCCLYFALIGIIGFWIGRIIPKHRINAESFPFAPFWFEKNGKIYERIKIHKWQSKLPDMSRIVPKFMPQKNLKGNYKERLPVMIEETCIAELIHYLLCFMATYCVKLWPGMGGFWMSFIYIILFNLPYILIQRYNRPRLMRIMKKTRRAIEFVCVEGVANECEC